MREDMFEVIIERPRGGRNYPRRPGRPMRELDEAPRMESMSRGRGGTKWLNENLAPLLRFLGRRVGRPWNEVHGEIAARLSLNSAVQKHVLDHVRQMVELHPVMVDGRPYYPVAHNGRLRALEGSKWSRFYVCPRTGLLMAAPRRGRKLPEPERDRVWIDPVHEAWRIEGVWYRIRFAPVPMARGRLRDVLLRRGLDENGVAGEGGVLHRAYGRADRYAVEKRQMSRREIVALARRRD